jgi:hypothetical protein
LKYAAARIAPTTTASNSARVGMTRCGSSRMRMPFSEVTTKRDDAPEAPDVPRVRGGGVDDPEAPESPEPPDVPKPDVPFEDDGVVVALGRVDVLDLVVGRVDVCGFAEGRGDDAEPPLPPDPPPPPPPESPLDEPDCVCPWLLAEVPVSV